MTPQDQELMFMLSEEAGEVTQAIGKLLRHGPRSFHPNKPAEDNKAALLREITDFMAIYYLAQAAGFLPIIQSRHVFIAMKRKQEWMKYPNGLRSAVGMIDNPLQMPEAL